MDNGHLVRYSAPTKFDIAEYGTIWEQMLDTTKEVYIQTSKDQDNPHWIRVGIFLEKVFAAKLYEDDFIVDCLRLYHL